MVGKHAGVSPLSRKLLRDIREGWKSFFAIWIICTLAITLYVGIDATWRGMDRNLSEQFSAGNLADLWAIGAVSDRTLRNLEALPGVDRAQRRISAEGTANQLQGEPVVKLLSGERGSWINRPLVRTGTDIPPVGSNSCVLQERFAQAHGIRIGDKLTVDIGNHNVELSVCGLGILPEYVAVLHNGEFSPDPNRFGYAYASSGALWFLPYNEALLTLEPGADVEAVKRAAQDLFDGSEAFVLVREDIKGIKMAMDESQQIQAMSYVFPLVFFVVAALITWTTMGRLVENQRLQIGTLFAQGYGKSTLAWHYTSYGLLLAALGSAGGFLGARYGIGPVLIEMIASLYTLPDAKPYLLPGVLAAVSAVLAAVTGGASVLSARAALTQTPAALMRPKTSGKGRRVMLENVGWLWRNMKFSAKMIQRNLWRNPMRACMGLIGVLGCTGLMLTGFGLRDSVDYVLRNYYTQTMRYDACAYLHDDAPDGYGQSIRVRTGASAAEERMLTSCEAQINGQWTLEQAFVFEDVHEMVYLTLEDGSPYRLPPEGVCLTRKASERYGLGIGDSVSLRMPGGRARDAEIVEIVDIQLGQGIYVSSSAWRALDLAPWKPNAVMLRGKDLRLDGVAEMDAVHRVRTIEQERASNEKVLDVLNLVVFLMVLFSGALALVVLYNLGQLNFFERIRELATLMVLGFTPREIKRLVLRENLLIAFAGIPVGLALGPSLHRLVLETGLPDTLEFVPFIQRSSWAYTAAFTFLFALIVNWMLGQKFRSINMVEALKSIE